APRQKWARPRKANNFSMSYTACCTWLAMATRTKRNRAKCARLKLSIWSDSMPRQLGGRHHERARLALDHDPRSVGHVPGGDCCTFAALVFAPRARGDMPETGCARTICRNPAHA